MRIVFRNFTGGEISSTLTARYDLQRFGTSVRCMENFLPGLHGDVTRRPGTRFIADLGSPSVLIPFSFNVDADQNFVLVLSDKKLRVSDGNSLLSVSLVAPWAEKDLYSLSFKQAADIVYVAHRDYPLYKIIRSGSVGAYVWSIEEVVLNQSIPAPGAPSVSFVRNNEDDTAGLAYTLRYIVVAVDSEGRESLPSPAGETAGKHPSDWVTGNYVRITWPAVANAAEYNIYREEAGYYGFIGISQGTTFIDNNYEADTSDTPKEDWNPFANGNYPGCVSFHQQRMVLAGTRKSPQSFYMSRTGDFENFRKSRPLQDDDPVEYTLASGSIDAIQWITSFGDLLIGTSGAEYKATGESGIITSKNISIASQSYWGSAALPPIIIGNSVLHVQRHGARVRDLFYSLEKDGYAGNDLSIMAPHLFDGHTLLQWAYQQTPGSRIWIIRDDGVLLCLTYMKEHEIFGFSRHITDGEFQSVAVVSGQTSDATFFVVCRIIDDEKHWFLERLAQDFSDTDVIEDAFFVDCGLTMRLSEPGTHISGLNHLEGRTVSVLANGSPIEGLVVHKGSIELPYPVHVVHVGLGYVSTLSPLPLETDTQNGTTLGKARAYGRCVARVHRTVGGQYGAERNEQYDFPFLPMRYGEPVPLFSGDLEFFPPCAQAADTSVWLIQDRPLPFHLIALACDVDFGEI